MTRKDPHWLAELAKLESYPHDPDPGSGSVDRIDTHISHVFLTRRRAYKLRRPVTLSFVDFSTPEERLADCLREVELNRRLAPDVYLGIAPIELDEGSVVVGPVSDEPVSGDHVAEHCVVMRRLAAGRDLKSLLERGDLRPLHVDRIASRLARFHREHGLGPAPDGGGRWVERSTAPARANIAALAEVPAELAPAGRIDEARRLGERFLETRAQDFELRHASGRAVDGHGDLHCEHVWFESADSEPLMVDCLEFRDDFRRIDAASDIAFLAMDLEYRGRPELAARLLRRYARESGDYHLFTVVDYFLSYRALVRAKVASLVAGDAAMDDAQREHAKESVRRHLELGLRFLRDRPPGAVVLVCGTIGTGKSTIAEELADRTGGVVISSDWLRREMPHDTAEDRYSDAARTAVYERLLAEARHVVLSGRTAILDATWSKRSWRDAARRWSEGRASSCSLLQVIAPREDVMERLAERVAAGNDASEAGPGLYDTIRAEFEDPAEWDPRCRVTIDSSAPDWRYQVASAAEKLRLV